MTIMKGSFVPRVPVLAPIKAMGGVKFLFHHWSLLQQRREQMAEHNRCDMILNDGTVWEVVDVDGTAWTIKNHSDEYQTVSPLRIAHRAADKWDMQS